MQSLSKAKQQYFKLMRLVNKGYELNFIVEQNKLYSVIGLNQKILLCEKKNYWESVSATDLYDLEDFLTQFMNNQKIIDDKLTENIRLALFGHSS